MYSLNYSRLIKGLTLMLIISTKYTLGLNIMTFRGGFVLENKIVSKQIDKTYCKVCKVCKQKMIQIPIRKYDSLMMLEYYCPDCEISEIKYENFETL